MKKFGFLIVLLSFLLACQKDYNKTKHAYQFIPNNTFAIIKINELNDFSNNIENHQILSTIYNKDIKKASKVLKHFNPKKALYVAFSNETDYIILTENNSDVFIVDSISNHTTETLVDLKINKTHIGTTIIYHKILGNTFAASNNLEILKGLNPEEENKTLSNLIETTNTKSVASLIFKTEESDYSKLLFTHKNSIADLSVIDLNYTDNNLNFNGIVINNDTISNSLDCFKDIIPQKTNSISIAPNTSKSLISITYSDFSIFNKNIHTLKKLPVDSLQTFLNFSNEVAYLENDDSNAIIVHALDSDLVTESISENVNVETYRDIEIFKFSNPEFFKTRLQPFLSYDNAVFFTVYDNFIVFSNKIETLKAILKNALNENTIANSEAYKTISENLSDEASLFIFKNSESLSETLGEKFSGYNANAVQYVFEDNYAHINGAIQKFKKRPASNSVTEAFTTQLGAQIITKPQTVKNHITKAYDIAIQDVNNVLYLISSSGNILWKKQLQGKILGKIEQIDTYKNGRLQLAFATSNRVYVLDRNGKDVGVFPLKFNDAITQPLSVFDYDKTKNYRLLVTQGKSVLMYGAKGKTINGFNYKNNGSLISTQPKHFRVGSKDYIAFAAGNTLQILNRQGNTRVTVKDKIRFSNNELYLYKNKFTTSNTLGQLVQVDTKGKLTTKNLNLTDKHYIETTSKTLVTMVENKLNIKSRTIDLDYGDYTKPQIFYLNDKIYVTVTDLQSKKILLFDSQAKPIPNFPVFGTSEAELQGLDKDKGIELITQSDDKTLVVYKLN